MTRERRSVFMTAVVIASAVAGGIAFTGSAAALNPDTSAPYPHSPGTSADDFPVSVVAQGGDAIVQDGMQSMTIDFGASGNFNGSVQNVSSDSVSAAITGENSSRTLAVSNVSTNRNGQVTVTFQQPVQVNAGERIVVDVANTTTPSADGDYTVGVSATTPSGTTDGPVSVNYIVASAELTFPNQSASQFSEQQQVNVSGVIPNAGYVGVFTVAENGSPDELVGNTQPIIARYNERNYTVNLSGNVEESQPLMAVAYYETSGDNQAERLNDSLDPAEDNVVTNNGVPANATGYVTTLDADARVEAGSEYDQGARLFFGQGEPETAYQLQTVENGELGQTVTQFQTAANGTATLNTSGLGEGQYAVTRIDDGSVVSLDNDSTTGPQDDSFFVTGQQFTETTDAPAGDNTTAGGNASGAGDGAGGNESGNESGGNASGGGGAGDSGAGGPGFGVAVAVVALLGAALLAARRNR